MLDGKLSRANLEATIRRLAENGFNIAYVRTWYRGATAYPSDVVAQAGGPRQHTAFVGRDPIAEAIEVGKRYGVQIAAWMEYGLVAHTSYATGDDPGPILTANPDWSMQDRDGEIATTPSQTGGLRFYWMDPAHPEVIAFLRDMAAELAARYPDLAIYEADRFRYPSLDWSYTPVSIERYMQETGNRNPKELAAGDAEQDEWRAWRRAQITHLMGEVYRAVKEANPRVAVSAAVVPPYMIDSMYDKMQYWPAWADSGYVDMLEPMLYLPDNAFPNQLRLAAEMLPEGFPFYAGISVDQAINDGSDAVFQVEEARQRGAEGVVLWYEGSLTDEKLETLSSGPFATHVLPPYDDRRVDDGDARKFDLEGGWETSQHGYGDGSRRLPAGAGGEAAWSVPLFRSGSYDLYARWTPSAENTSEARYELVVNGTVRHTFEADQQQGQGWQHLGHVSLGYQDDVVVRVGGSAEGAVVADAVRLVRVAPFRATEALATGTQEVYVRFNYAPDPQQVAPAAFAIDGADVLGAQVSATDERIVVLQASPLDAGVDYTLHVDNLVDELGRPVQASSLSMRYDPASLEVVVDDDVNAFRADGSWATATGGLNDGVYRVSSGGVAANRARWVAQPGSAGRYEVAVYLPQGTEGRAQRAGYLIGHAAGFDTVYVSQNMQEAGWKTLGIYYYEDGGSGFVQLQGSLSSEGEITADAVRWRRTLLTVATEDAPRVSTFSVAPPYPNPVSDQAYFSITLETSASLEAAVFDLLGRRVAELPRRMYGPGVAVLPLDLSHLPAGSYFVRFTCHPLHGGGGRQQTQKVTVVR